MKKGGTLRPFKISCGVSTRGYSRPLQRVMTDFGADESFTKASNKINEHYGITIPVSGERNITLLHARQMNKELEKTVATKNKKARKKEIQNNIGKDFIISETDGSMVPIVVIKKTGKDRRKNKEVIYREARLTLARANTSDTPVFSVTLSDIDTVGKHIRSCIDQAGCGSNSRIYAIGDGVPWIANQVDIQFGSQAKYILDFYHASEYLAAASHECATIEPSKWLHAQQQLLKCGKAETVLNNLRNYALEHEASATYKCYHYMQKRINQLHYDEAIKNDIPIGSGEIESAHRYIIQDRIKITGAWWIESNAESMASLSVLRANNDWNNYWGATYTA
jgi:hypothetical protein